MSEPFVSVVTPVYNTGEFIEQAIRSVLEQTYQNFEYIICNNHSTDNSAASRHAMRRWTGASASSNPRNSCRRHRTSTSHSSKSRPRAAIPK